MEQSELLEALRRALAERTDVRVAFLFGSRATGRARPGSDVDVAFLPEGDWSLGAELDLQGRLARAARASVDLIRLDTAPLPLAWEVVRAGIALAGMDGAISRYRAAIALEHADAAPLVERAARDYARRVAERGAPE